MKLPDLLAMLHNVRTDANGPCVYWTGNISTGYGRIRYKGKQTLVHRIIYEVFKGPIPAALTIDHTCHNKDDSCAGGSGCLHRRCENPGHLEAVLKGINVLRGKAPAAVNNRKIYCPKGHLYSPRKAQRFGRERHWRICKKCTREYRKGSEYLKRNAARNRELRRRRALAANS